MGTRRPLSEVAARLPPEQWRERAAAADEEAAMLEQALALVGEGASRSAALRAVLPDRKLPSVLRRLRRYEEGGRDALFNRQLPVTPRRKMDGEARGVLRALVVADPDAGSVLLAERLSGILGRSIGATTVQLELRKLGMSRPKGRPKRKDARPGAAPDQEPEHEVVTPLPLAGCELLKAVDEDIGAVAALTEAIHAALPEPEPGLVDDPAGRDERGRFLPDYNQTGPRTQPDLGERFDTVETKRLQKNLPAMRVASDSVETHHRKNLSLVLLPVVVRGPRWSALEHWRGDLLGELVGFAYQAASLDKHLRGLKYAGAASAAREAVTSFWLDDEGAARDEQTGAVILYVDAKTKPLWTRHWTRATRVSDTGRVMPAVTTVSLHSGAGTPLIYRSWSGHVSIPKEVRAFLDTYDRHAGEEMVRRVVVIDREAHAVWLFKELSESGRLFIIPLRSNVVGPKARFEDVGPWSPHQDGPDEVCDAHLWLNDGRKGQEPMRLRVVGRRRHRTGKVAWFATNTPADEFPATDVIRAYFERWPAQEHVYRDGSGVVGLDALHGYGKKKVADVAVLDRLEKLEGSERRLLAAKGEAAASLAEARRELAEWEEAQSVLEPGAIELRTEIATRLRAGGSQEELELLFDRYETFERWLGETREECRAHQRAADAAGEALHAADNKLRHLAEERVRLEGRREIFTVDVELDELMTSFKLTFMNLCSVLMKRYLGTRMELETLIEAVLTLPGERAVTPSTETVRLFRPSRDARTMAAVEKACAGLTARGLIRNGRTLRFEVTAGPASARPPPDDPVDP